MKKILLFAALVAAAGLSTRAEEAKPKPDMLTTCPVSGDKIGGDMGKPFVFTYKDQEVKLCCKDCKKDFDKDPEKYMAKIRAADLKPDLLATCPVSGDKLGEMGDAFVFAYKGQEVKLCCKNCKKDFDKDPDKYIAKIRAADKK